MWGGILASGALKVQGLVDHPMGFTAVPRTQYQPYLSPVRVFFLSPQGRVDFAPCVLRYHRSSHRLEFEPQLDIMILFGFEMGWVDLESRWISRRQAG